MSTEMINIKASLQKEKEWDVRSRALVRLGGIAKCVAETPKLVSCFAKEVRALKREMNANVRSLLLFKTTLFFLYYVLYF